MDNTNYAQILSERILALRKEKGLTQEALAQQLGVSFQAVSKWENEQSCPDIALLPLLAEVFEVSVDSLFGREAKEEQAAEGPSSMQGARREEEWGSNPVFSACMELPWPDDQTIRGVVCWGRKILSHDRIPKRQFVFDASLPEYTWILRYSPLNVTAKCGLAVEGNIQGGASVGSHMRCNDIGGDVSVGSHMSCRDVLKGGVSAGSHIKCGNVGGNASAGSHIVCGNVGGSADAGNKIECGDVGGDVRATKVARKK